MSNNQKIQNKRKFNGEEESISENDESFDQAIVFGDQVKKRKIEESEDESDYSDDDSSTISSDEEDEFEEHDDCVGELLINGTNPRECPFLEEFTLPPRLYHQSLVSISKIPEYCWVNIYSFIGFENYFINRIYKLNSILRETLYERECFWEGIFTLIWPDISMYKPEWKEYFFKKFIAFQTQKNLNPHIQTNKISFLDSIPVESNFSNCGFIESQLDPTTFHFKQANNTIYASNMNWIVNVFLPTSPKIVGLRLETRLNTKVTMKLFATFNKKEFAIFDEHTVVLSGIQKLFHNLKLKQTVHVNDELVMHPRFQNLEFGELMDSYYFVWFCNSILCHVPFPIEEVYGLLDYSNHLSFGIDDDRNKIIAKHYKYHKMLGLP